MKVLSLASAAGALLFGAADASWSLTRPQWTMAPEWSAQRSRGASTRTAGKSMAQRYVEALNRFRPAAAQPSLTQLYIGNSVFSRSQWRLRAPNATKSAAAAASPTPDAAAQTVPVAAAPAQGLLAKKAPAGAAALHALAAGGKKPLLPIGEGAYQSHEAVMQRTTDKDRRCEDGNWTGCLDVNKADNLDGHSYGHMVDSKKPDANAVEQALKDAQKAAALKSSALRLASDGHGLALAAAATVAMAVAGACA